MNFPLFSRKFTFYFVILDCRKSETNLKVCININYVLSAFNFTRGIFVKFKAEKYMIRKEVTCNTLYYFGFTEESGSKINITVQ